jgi:hypothetical protein
MTYPPLLPQWPSLWYCRKQVYSSLLAEYALFWQISKARSSFEDATPLRKCGCPNRAAIQVVHRGGYERGQSLCKGRRT